MSRRHICKKLLQVFQTQPALPLSFLQFVKASPLSRFRNHGPRPTPATSSQLRQLRPILALQAFAGTLPPYFCQVPALPVDSQRPPQTLATVDAHKCRLSHRKMHRGRRKFRSLPCRPLLAPFPPTSVKSLPCLSIRSAHHKPWPLSTLTNADFLTAKCIEEGENFDLCGGDARRPTADMAVQEAAALMDAGEQAARPRTPDARGGGWAAEHHFYSCEERVEALDLECMAMAWTPPAPLCGRSTWGRLQRHNSSSFLP
ncbi:hypothetical protein D1007_39621 [Hordeum vulgare]|nr:hypothetical protein D1007_39621 [Hordeum vulgare]